MKFAVKFDSGEEDVEVEYVADGWEQLIQQIKLEGMLMSTIRIEVLEGHQDVRSLMNDMNLEPDPDDPNRN